MQRKLCLPPGRTFKHLLGENLLPLKRVPQPKIQVGILDDDPLRLIGYRALLDGEPDIEIAGFPNGEKPCDTKIVVVVRHSRSSNLSGEMEKIKVIAPQARVLAAGRHLTDVEIMDAISSGAKGCYCETAPATELARAIRAVHQGIIWAPRRLVAEVIAQILESTPSSIRQRRARLTEREKEVLQMLAAGRSNKEIAVPLGISLRTVKAHVSHLMHKLGVKNRIGASVQAVRNSMVEIQ